MRTLQAKQAAKDDEVKSGDPQQSNPGGNPTIPKAKAKIAPKPKLSKPGGQKNIPQQGTPDARKQETSLASHNLPARKPGSQHTNKRST
eukprot:9532578-Alexandrium_andersonii.AAC.1